MYHQNYVSVCIWNKNIFPFSLKVWCVNILVFSKSCKNFKFLSALVQMFKEECAIEWKRPFWERYLLCCQNSASWTIYAKISPFPGSSVFQNWREFRGAISIWVKKTWISRRNSDFESNYPFQSILRPMFIQLNKILIYTV